mmetsp:Transcript_2591/g.8707  ORF Transcript_2591/g.8707 Transcript_2591/m.8707 type:complete len:999 (-) Transcript_2591:401-3397(-)
MSGMDETLGECVRTGGCGPHPGGEYSRLHLAVIARTRAGQGIHVSTRPTDLEEADGDLSTYQKTLPLVTTAQDWPLWSTTQPVIVLRDKLHMYRYSLFDGSTLLGHERRVRAVLPQNVNWRTSDVMGDFVGTTLNSVLEVSEASYPAASLKMEQHNRACVHIVCFHLPVRLEKKAKWQATWDQSLIARTEGSVSNDLETQWFGTVFGARSDGMGVAVEDYDNIQAALQDMKCTPLFFPMSVYQGAYLGFCKQILWPSFHNVDILDLTCACWNPTYSDPAHVWDQSVTEHWWEAYVDLNRAFCTELHRKVKDDDVIWVHDYHLMLLPSMLSAKYVGASAQSRINIIFFLHIPFPTSQIFRSLTRGKDLLTGIIGANVVGFHAFDHARHFLNACKRLMGVTHRSALGGLTGVEYLGRTVMVVVRHVSIEPKEIATVLCEGPVTNSDSGNSEVPFYQAAIEEGRHMLAGVDTCQRLSGIPLKLLAFERFLWDYEHWRGRVALVQLALQEEKRLDDEYRTSSEIDKLVARINTLFPGAVYCKVTKIGLSRHERLQLWRRSSVFVSTAIREGLNLAPFEYIFTHQQPCSPGLVLASEFSATASLLNGALRLNPFDLAGTAAAFDTAMSMPQSERARRHARDLPYVLSRPSGKWTREILHDMWLSSNQPCQLREMTSRVDKLVCEQTRASDVVASIMDGAFETLGSACGIATRRIVLLDFGGIVDRRGENIATYLKPNLSRQNFPLHVTRALPCATDEALLALSMDLTTDVNVVSDVSMDALMATLCWSSIGLVASGGMYFSRPSPTGPLNPASQPRLQSQRIWGFDDCDIDWSRVNQTAIPILKWFTARTNGSCILQRDLGIAWSYYRTDPEWGREQASKLMHELDRLIAVHNVEVRHADGIIELIPRQCRKCKVVSRILDQSKPPLGGLSDFIVCISDDAGVIETVYSIVADHRPSRCLFISTIGKKSSISFSFLPDHHQVSSSSTHISGTSASRLEDCRAT